MKISKYIFVLNALLYVSCVAWQDAIVSQGNSKTAIQNAIWDFMQTSKLSKNDNVFHVECKDFKDELIVVSIRGNENKLLPGVKNKIGTNIPFFPTDYMKKEGNLFYWYDSTKTISNDLILMLSKFNIIDSLNVNGFVGIPMSSSLIDESKKSLHYYFCKNDLSIYKKISTNIGIDNYEPPKIKCGCKND